MNHYSSKKSRVTGALWLAMAVFFVVFCSCPVKRYIRMHLYQHKPVTEKTDGASYSNYDIKDCTIAERHQQADMSLISIFLHAADNASGCTAVFFMSLLSGIAFFLYRKRQPGYVVSLHRGKPVPIPVFLWVRHLQI